MGSIPTLLLFLVVPMTDPVNRVFFTQYLSHIAKFVFPG
jgi:hypothetical protein